MSTLPVEVLFYIVHDSTLLIISLNIVNPGVVLLEFTPILTGLRLSDVFYNCEVIFQQYFANFVHLE